MKKNDIRKPDSAHLSNERPQPSEWRVHGNRAEMADMQEHGDLSPAVDDNGVNTCVKKKYPDAPGFNGSPCESGELSGAFDGAAASRRSAARLRENTKNSRHGSNRET